MSLYICQHKSITVCQHCCDLHSITHLMFFYGKERTLNSSSKASFQTMCEGVNTSPCPLVNEVAAQPVPGPGIQYLNWAGITASWEEVLAALLLVDTFGLRLHTRSCRMRNKRFVIVYFTLPKSSRLDRHEKTWIPLEVTHLVRLFIFLLIPKDQISIV